MSTRQLRRLENELKSVSLKSEQEEEQEEESDDEPRFKSPFVQLQSFISDMQEDLVGEDSEEHGTLQSHKVSEPINSKAKSKKKNRNKKNRKSPPSWEGYLIQREPSSQNHTKEKESVGTVLPKVFWVDVSRLHSKHEIRKLFGSSIDILQDSSEKKVGRGRRGGISSLSRPIRSKLTSRHKSILVSPEVDWLGTPKDLKLAFIEEDISGYKWFRYDLEGIFVTTRTEFENIVAVGDPSLLVDFVSTYPYHVEALVRLSEAYELMGEPERSVNLLERAIYILEGAWPANFKPFHGNCRLKFEQGSNYLLFMVLFRYSHALIRRGLYQTSLQVTKLVYNLDWEHDPMGTLLYIDSVSLLAGDYIFVINSYESASHVKLDILPNYRLSYALAKFYLGHEDANQELLNAILTFPGTVLLMLDTWKLEMDESYWNILENFRLLEEEELSSSVATMLDKISRVFVSVAEPVWKSIPVRNWLLECVMMACSMMESNRRLVQARKNFFDLLDANLFSQVGVADFVHSSTSLPANLVQNPIGFAEGESSSAGEEGYQSIWRILVENLLGGSHADNSMNQQDSSQNEENRE